VFFYFMKEKNGEISKVIIKEKEEAPERVNAEKKRDFIEVLKMFSPGTSLRLALDDILRARMGALIVINTEKLFEIVEGGFKVNCKFSAQRLVELAKMDGAIIISEDLKKILSSNVLLFPDVRIPTKETGTRHKAAERTAKHTGTIVIAVSQRKNKITVYSGDISYELENSSEILRRAAETLQILEKQKEIFNDLLINLNILEINNLVTTSDISTVLQRIEIIKRISEMVKRYLVELGKEGIIVSMRLKELTKNLGKERDLILKDYFESKSPKADSILDSMNFDFLLETPNISRMLFEELHDKPISARGVRILSRINLLEKDSDVLLGSFKSISEILDADRETFVKIFKNESLVDSLRHNLENLRERIMAGKNI